LIDEIRKAQNVVSFVTGGLCIIPFTFIIIKVNKRIPLSFFINILLQTMAIISRALNELIFFNDLDALARILITPFCVGLIEISFAYFVF
jgi:hypothetical protein